MAEFGGCGGGGGGGGGGGVRRRGGGEEDVAASCVSRSELDAIDYARFLPTIAATSR